MRHIAFALLPMGLCTGTALAEPSSAPEVRRLSLCTLSGISGDNFHGRFPGGNYPEPGSLVVSSDRRPHSVRIENADGPHATVTIPGTDRPGTMHFIVAVTDSGTPALTRYKRFIINVSRQ